MREDGDSVYKGRSLNESEELDKATRQRSGSLKSSGEMCFIFAHSKAWFILPGNANEILILMSQICNEQ